MYLGSLNICCFLKTMWLELVLHIQSSLHSVLHLHIKEMLSVVFSDAILKLICMGSAATFWFKFNLTVPIFEYSHILSRVSLITNRYLTMQLLLWFWNDESFWADNKYCHKWVSFEQNPCICFISSAFVMASVNLWIPLWNGFWFYTLICP